MIEILFSFSRVAIATLGNRLWGYENHFKWVGVLFTTLAFISRFPGKLELAPLFAATVFLCRCFSTRPLNNVSATGDWTLAIGRAYIWALIPIFIAIVSHDVSYLLLAMGSPVIAVFYWIAGQFKDDPVAYGEIPTGAYIGLSLF